MYFQIFLYIYFFALYTCNQYNYPMFISEKKKKKKRKILYLCGCKFTGTFCKMAFRQQALLSTFSPPPTSRVCWWLRPCWRKKKKKKEKKRKMQTHPSLLKVQLLAPPVRRFAMATNALLHSYRRGHHWQARQCIQVRQAGARMPRTCFWAEKFQKQFFKLRVWVRRSLERTKCWKSTHTQCWDECLCRSSTSFSRPDRWVSEAAL